MPQTLPFWGIVVIFLIQMWIPQKFELKIDLLINLVLGLILTVSWMLLIHYIYIINYTGTKVANAIPFAPILALGVVPFYRFIYHLNEDKAS
jgi:hypothetical protein